MFLVSDNADWALDEIAKEQSFMTGSKILSPRRALLGLNPRLHFLSPDLFLSHRKLRLNVGGRRNSFDFFHGLPTDHPKYRLRMEQIIDSENQLLQIRVTNNSARRSLQDLGVSVPVHVIPIAVDLEKHSVIGLAQKQVHRQDMGLPVNKTIVGSFQKDGQGWDRGLEPKLEKGPDLLVETLDKLEKSGLEPFVLLSGPSRGYVLRKLEERGIPHRNLGVLPKKELIRIYSLLDIYLVTSRYEGGPRALLESLASGVPVVSTPVGQSIEVMTDRGCSSITKTFSADEIAQEVESLLARFDVCSGPMKARTLAARFSLEKVAPLWRSFIIK